MENSNGIEEQWSNEENHVEKKVEGHETSFKCEIHSWKELVKHDSFDFEASRFIASQGHGSPKVSFFFFCLYIYVTNYQSQNFEIKTLVDCCIYVTICFS